MCRVSSVPIDGDDECLSHIALELRHVPIGVEKFGDTAGKQETRVVRVGTEEAPGSAAKLAGIIGPEDTV